MPPVLACLATAVELDAAGSRPGCLPAVLLTGGGAFGCDADLSHLVDRGWAYAEPPVHLTPITAPHVGTYAIAAHRSVLFTPCPLPDWQRLAIGQRPPRSRNEWSLRVRELQWRCALVLAPAVDPYSSDLVDELDRQAIRGRVVWTPARITVTEPDSPDWRSPVCL